MDFRGRPLLTGTPPSGAGMGHEFHAPLVSAIVRWKIAQRLTGSPHRSATVPLA